MNEGASAAAALDRPSTSPWPRVAISDVARTSSGTTPSRRRTERYFGGGTVPWVKTLDLRNGEISGTDECVTDLAVQETSLQVYPPGTVLVAMYGGFNQIGRTGLLRIPACVNQALSAIQVNRDRVLPEYLLAVLNFRVEHWKAVASSSRKDPNITGNDVRAFELPLPSMEEQRSIAAALSDVDTLLAKLDQLIAKKRNLKQAAVQRLLGDSDGSGAGGPKLPAVPLSRICDFISKGSTPTTYGFKWEASGVLFLRSECVSDNGLDLSQSMFISPSAHAALRRSIVRDGDLLITITGNVGRVVRFDAGYEANINQHIARIRVSSSDVDPGYVFHVLSQPSYRARFNSITTGQAYPQLSLRQVRDAEIPLRSLPEQKRITEILSDMDTEITALEARRDKTRQLKEGMMQALLTGRIRLV